MKLMLRDFRRAFVQFTDPTFRKVLTKSVLWTLLLVGPFVLLIAAIVQMIAGFFAWLLPAKISLPWIGSFSTGTDALSGYGLSVFLFLSVFLMIPVASFFISLFLEEIAAAVEAKHYPDLPKARKISVAEMTWDSIRFFGLFLVVNLLALTVYLTFSSVAPLVFWALNGLLLGREYFQIVAMRRLSAKAAKALGKRHFWTIWASGTLMAVALSLPILSLVIPIFGVAAFTHQFQRLR